MVATLQLQQMVVDLRQELGHSTNLAAQTQTAEMVKYYLQRAQRQLYQSHDWPHLKQYEELSITSGQRLLPELLLVDYSRVDKVWVNWASRYYLLEHGIGPREWSEMPVTSHSWPPRKYDWDATAKKMHVWPTPNSDGTATVRGTRRLDPFEADDDFSSLDGQLIVLYAAAMIAAREKKEDAPLKLQEFQEYKRHLLTNYEGNKGRIQTVPTARQSLRPGIDYVPE